MKRTVPKSVLSIIVPLLVWSSYSWAQDITDPQSGSHEVSQATVKPRFDWVAPEQYMLAEPPQLSLEQLRRLEEALKETHLPGPPIPVNPAIDAESIGPIGPPAERPSEGKARPSLQELGAGGVPPLAPGDFVFERNQDLGSGAPSTNTLSINEPSAGTKGNVVFYSGNRYGALSTNGGQTFSFVNPFTGPFPPVNGGFCCDQIVIYEPSRDAMFYLQQYIRDSSNNGTQRINVDMGGDGTFDCAYDFTPQLFGRPNGEWLDFPDLVLGDNFLYHTSNMFNGVLSFTAAVIARYPLDQMTACQNINFSFLVQTDRGSFRATHGTRSTVYWGAHNTTSQMRIYRWDESSGTVFWDNINISAWNSGTGMCPGPDGRDWCGRSDGRHLGAYVANGVIGFMWNSAQGGGFPFPHIRWARFVESNRNLINEPTIWSQGFAWQYPSVGVNTSGNIAGTTLWGGGTFFPNCAAWIIDDISGGAFESFQAVNSTDGPLANVSGDYLSSRPHWPDFTNSWIATCFSLQGGGANSNARPRYVWFGRERDLPTTICGVLGFASSTPSTLGALPTAIWLVLPVLFVAGWRLSLKRKKGTNSGRT
jgi:hypothetical protein